MTPARFGPVELGKLTRSPMVEVYHALDGARKFLRSKGVAVTSAIAMIAKLRDGGRPERLERPRVLVKTLRRQGGVACTAHCSPIHISSPPAVRALKSAGYMVAPFLLGCAHVLSPLRI